MTASDPPRPSVPPVLRTLGALHLAGSPVTRPKPLLLLAYLAHEGPTDRERLARLFFMSSRDPRDALSTTLRRLGPLVERTAKTDGRLRARVTTDALEFQRHAVSAEPQVALGRYRGSFLQGSPVGSGVEVEEWIVSTREHLGSIARDLYLEVARRELDRNRTAAAWLHAKTAIGLTESFALEPESTAQIMQRFGEVGLPVPEGWWRAMAALGLDRPRHHVPTTAAASNDRARATSDGRRERRVARLGTRSPRAAGLRKSRCLTDRP